MTKSLPATIADEVERYLRTGQTDPHLAAWTGGYMERAGRAHEDLRSALVREVRRLAKGRAPEVLPQADSVALTRGKVEPMVRGLFPRAEQDLVLATLEKSVVFLTSANIEPLLLERGFDSSAWTLANLYLASLGADLLGEDAPRLVGLSEETTCFVSSEYFAEDDPFADFIVHEAAHIFHNCKRATVGLRETRTKEWLLDIEYRKRETFAYSCEAYARVLERGRNPSERRARAEDYGRTVRIFEERVDPAEVASIVLAAAAARNGWRVILARCAPTSRPRTALENQDDDPGAGDDTDDEDSSSPDPSVKKPRRLPASLGLSVMLPASTKELVARVSWADYLRLDGNPGSETEEAGRKIYHWSRTFHEPAPITIALDADSLREGQEIPSSGGLRIQGQMEKTPDGTVALAIFVVNARTVIDVAARRDESYAFQLRLELECAAGFLGRTNRSDESSDDLDERVNDLQFREATEFAVGHGIAVEVEETSALVTRIATTWLPQTDVHRVVARKLQAVEVRMEALADIPDGASFRKALIPLVEAYRDWISKQRVIPIREARRRETQAVLMDQARRASDRIAEGIELLATSSEVRTAFKLMNAVMAQAERKARKDQVPEWRLFQLAFILLNLGSMDSETHEDRQRVDLIFFPTGGGKTQAYLGLIAHTLLLRRLRGASRPDGGLGVAVILRYTLRLLTLDQLGRAATLICALELLRQKTPSLGSVRFAIGLWVGRSATANRLDDVAQQITEYKNDASPRAQSPFPLTNCPWCGTILNRDGFVLRPSKTHPEEVAVGCAALDCPFNLGSDRQGLPVLFVDEQLYRELPSFIVATVDKFALLPWRGETGMLLGRAMARTGGRFFGPCDSPAEISRAEVTLPEGLRPPELIVQDELHLISGPLGSMVGLYEAALLTLCANAKIVASTATVRRAQQQVRRLYSRDVALFPPPGVNATDTFFAQTEKDGGARRYLGVAAPGRPLKTILLRTYISLLAAAQRLHDGSATGDSGADPYLTLVGYFNSLRELGGMRRLVEDEVRKQVMRREQRRPVGFPAQAPHPWYRRREIKAEPVELTSREKTLSIKETKAHLALPHGDKQAVDVLLASNMISVGVDIERLGLMCIAGQPKTTSEYIQASSRVGRQATRPGLVVTVYNLTKPRDRSHYERFSSYHASFYRSVEATSVTPFSGPALDRGLPGVVVSLARLFDIAMTAPAAVMAMEAHRPAIEQLMREVAHRAQSSAENRDESGRLGESVFRRALSLLDAWKQIAAKTQKEAGGRVYSKLDPAGRDRKPLLHAPLDDVQTLSDDERRFQAPLSMRDVEPSVHLWLTRQPLGGYSERVVKPKEPAETLEPGDTADG